MTQNQSQTIPKEKFLVMSVNLLYRAFLESSRTEAKKVFRQMAEGDTVHMTNVQMEDKSTVRFDVALDHSEYRGKLNFGAFRASVASLVAQISDTLREQKEVTVFTAENDPNVMIFGITGVTVEKNEPSVMVLGADAGSGQPSVLLRLMYLEHGQFAEGVAAGNAAGSADPAATA